MRLSHFYETIRKKRKEFFCWRKLSKKYQRERMNKKRSENSEEI